MARKRFWSGFAAGAGSGLAAGIGAWLLWETMGPGRNSRIIRLEKSIQIGRPVDEVFRAWSDLENLPRMSSVIESVERFGDRSHWRARVDGKQIEWDAELVQVILNQSLGWKSVNGPKHSGRIHFSSIGNDTLVHVSMNYAPPVRLFRPMLSPFVGQLEGVIERVFRDFKAALEGKGQSTLETGRATGTFGPEADLSGQTQHTRFGGPTLPVEYTRPPEAKS